jgi:integrase/recombinase XerD
MGAPMQIRLKYLVEDVDRHGNVRRYVRIKGRRKVRIQGQPGSEAFMTAYAAAVEGAEAESPRHAVAPGSFRFLCSAYFASPDFRALDPSTQHWRRRALEEISESTPKGSTRKRGTLPVALMEPKHVRELRDEKADKPGAANERLKALHALFRFAVEAQHVTHDPTRDVALIKYRTRGHPSWTLEDVARFEARHPIGSKARLAMALLLYTAGRREDAVRLGPQHVRAGRIKYTQAKNEHRCPAHMDIPLHPDLAAMIDATPSGALAFPVNTHGRPFTPHGFGKWFRLRCNEAGLPHCSAHGLRKAAAGRLAEQGATPHEIMSITGHRTLQEVERYTRAARQAKLADQAMDRLTGQKANQTKDEHAE